MTKRTPHHASRQVGQGFTLIELMIVIVIIIVIAALSLTGLRRMRDYADKVNSIKNLSQLQLANTTYAADHNGSYVSLYATDEDGARTGFWYQDPTYLGYLTGDANGASGKRLRAAPAAFLDPKVYRARKTMYYSMAANYGMAESGLMGQSGPNVRAAHHINQISNPSGAMAFATSTDYRVGYNGRFTWTEGQARSSNGAMAYRYRGNALVAYFDGHVGEMSKADIKEIDTFRSGKNNYFWNPRAK